MQKKIIALAVAGLVSGAAFAQSNVTVYGILDIGYLDGSQDIKATNRLTGTSAKTNTDYSSTGFQGGALSSNRLGFMGTEDLGNGLKAKFQLEFGLQESDYMGSDTSPDTGSWSALGQSVGGGTSQNTSAMTTRYQNIGLESDKFGGITVGRQATLIDNTWAVGSAGMKNNAVGQMYNSRFSDARDNELLTYMSPNFSGFQVGAQYGKGKMDPTFKVTGGALNTSDTLERTNYGFSATYANGPLNVGFGYNNEQGDDYWSDATVPDAKAGAATERDSWLIGANYNFGIVKVFGQYFDGGRDNKTFAAATTNVTKANTDISGWELGIHVPVTAQITLAGTYFDASSDLKTTNTNATLVTKTDTDIYGYQLAALYSLSKRTTAYAMYGYQESDGSTKNSTATVNSKNSQEDSQFAIGVRHSF